MTKFKIFKEEIFILWELHSKILVGTVHECSLDGPLQTLRFLFRYEVQNGHKSAILFFFKRKKCTSY
jgi:hypothetical protein